MNVFVITGTQEPFDRLIRTIDNWAGFNKDIEVFAQIGKTKYMPQHLEWTDFLSVSDFDDRFEQCSLIISHAGMGTIISALVKAKPIIVLPRLASFKEHRNNHQMDTAICFDKLGMIHTAYNEQELENYLGRLSEIHSLKKIDKYASKTLLDEIDRFITRNED